MIRNLDFKTEIDKIKKKRDKQLVKSTIKLFEEIDQLQTEDQQLAAYQIIFAIIENILNYPYFEDLRIISIEQLNQNLLIIRDALLNQLDLKVKQTIDILEIDEKFLKQTSYKLFKNCYGVDLTADDAFKERRQLFISQEEATEIFEVTQCKQLEEYIIEIGENTQAFQEVLTDLLRENVKVDEFIGILKNLWVENNLMHRIAIYYKQSFADEVSRAFLIDQKDKNSKFARNLLMIDVIVANRIFEQSNEQYKSIDDYVKLFCLREYYIHSKEQGKVFEIDDVFLMALGNDEAKFDKLWTTIRNIIIERVSRKIIVNRPYISQVKLEQWITFPEPEYNLSQMPTFSQAKIDDLPELKEKILRKNTMMERTFGFQLNQVFSQDIFKRSDSLDKQRTVNQIFSQANFEELKIDDTLDERIKLVVWGSPTWLHKLQLDEDNMYFSVINDIINDEEISSFLDKVQVYQEFINQKSNKEIDYENDLKQQFTSRYKKSLESNDQQDDKILFTQKQVKRFPYNEDIYLQLYKEFQSRGYQASIFNNRFNVVVQYQQSGIDINIKNEMHWRPIHCAAYQGSILILKQLLKDPLLFLNERTKQNQTAIQISIEQGHIYTEENATLLLLERGAKLEKDLWDKLLVMAINNDLMTYFRLAFQKDINIHDPLNKEKPSLHKAICMNAQKILSFYQSIYSPKELEKMMNQPDFQGLSAKEYADQNQNGETKDLLENMLMGEIKMQKNESAVSVVQNDLQNKLFIANMNQNQLLATINELRKTDKRSQDMELEQIKTQLQVQNKMMVEITEKIDNMQKQQSEQQKQTLKVHYAEESQETNEDLAHEFKFLNNEISQNIIKIYKKVEQVQIDGCDHFKQVIISLT
ncbi:UNKNOWN [Stylonychia lemnae]|uniref:Uncharacterized protein n=1 Tax=Stylonychia lemnae TaxID=5949 RepID=A0A078AAD1_STYLE|nr:UNKNOWN [Stylonychia lemnae]|eukprot:CDW78552.1 UNKNOWN [Stylonychia lemnae]